jgi:hypothetical protein
VFALRHQPERSKPASYTRASSTTKRHFAGGTLVVGLAGNLTDHGLCSSTYTQSLSAEQYLGATKIMIEQDMPVNETAQADAPERTTHWQQYTS